MFTTIKYRIRFIYAFIILYTTNINNKNIALNIFRQKIYNRVFSLNIKKKKIHRKTLRCRNNR